MSRILELLDFLDREAEHKGSIPFNAKLVGLMNEAQEEYKATLPSPLPDDFVEIG